MLTDKQKYIALLNSFGISYTETQNETAGNSEIECEANEHAKVTGYTGFSMSWLFDHEGNFMHVSILE